MGGDDVEGLVVEYGVAAGDEGDKWYVDELKDWEIGEVTWYFDSFGRVVRPGMGVVGGGVAVMEFREEEDEEPSEEGEEERRRDGEIDVEER